MFTRVTSYQINPAQTEELRQMWEANVPKIWKEQKGYVRGYLLGNTSTGKGIVVTVWESEEAANEYERSGAFERAIGPSRKYFTGAPVVDGYDLEVEA